MLRPPIWMRKLEWPIHVMTRSVAAARGVGNAFLESGKRAAKSRRLMEWTLGHPPECGAEPRQFA
jgi:hypothetical protein